MSYKFLGASIVDFNANLGWGDSPSSLTVRLVEDFKDGDQLIEPTIMMPTVFEIGDFKFGGIIVSWSQSYDFNGYPIYEVVLNDPRDVLNGVQLILNGYTGTVSAPNVINIYGYLENQSFGSSKRNEAGIPWGKIRSTVELLSSGLTDYGGPILLGGVQYRIDLSNLPNLPDYYRISNDNMSLMDFINEICNDSNHDYFFELNADALNVGSFYIQIHTVDRNRVPEFGAISRFVTSTPGATSKRSGFDFANETTSKFLVGGNVSRMYLQYSYGDEDDLEPWEQILWPFWGFDNDGNVILGEGFDNEHQFTVNIEHLGIPGFNSYTIDVAELRAALKGKDNWREFILMHTYNKYRIATEAEELEDRVIKEYFVRPTDPTAPLSVQVTELQYDLAHYQQTNELLLLHKIPASLFCQYPRSLKLKPNPHFKKGWKLGGSYQMGLSLPILWQSKYYREDHPDRLGVKHDITFIGSQTPANMGNTYSYGVDTEEDAIKPPSDDQKIIIDKIFNMVNDYATNYYGRKFMVALPFILSSEDGETGIIRTSQSPENTGFLDESLYDEAADQNIIPVTFRRDERNRIIGYNIDPRITDVDGRFFCYARFDETNKRYIDVDSRGHREYTFKRAKIDYRNIPADSLILGKEQTIRNIFWEDGRRRLNKEIYRSVFVKSTVEPYIVYLDKDTLFSPRAVINLPGQVTVNWEEDRESIVNFGLNLQTRTKILAGTPRDIEIERGKILDDGIKQFGADLLLRLERSFPVKYPSLIALPLKSNVEYYGPWYKAGSFGKTEYEQDDTLVPWNFASWRAMNNAAESKVNSAINTQQQIEQGSVEFPGIPGIRLGSILISGGPYVTNINVSISDGGIKTNYNMATWTPQPYKLNKVKLDRFTRLQEKQRKITQRNLDKVRERNTNNASLLIEKLSVQERISSSHALISSQPRLWGQNTVIQPDYNLQAQIPPDDYINRAFTSADGLFTGFSTAPRINNIDYSGIIPSSVKLITDFPSWNVQPNDAEIYYSGIDISAHTLNPYQSGTGIGIFSNGLSINDYRSDANSVNWNNIRGIGLRMPMIGVGWGFGVNGGVFPHNSGEVITYLDESGNEVSESGDGSKFRSDYLWNTKNWKAGPIDFRWDDTRGVWSYPQVTIARIIDSSGKLNGYPKTMGPCLVRCSEMVPDINYIRVSGYEYATEEQQAEEDYMPIPYDSGYFAEVNLRATQNYFDAIHIRNAEIIIGNDYLIHNIGDKRIVDVQHMFLDYE